MPQETHSEAGLVARQGAKDMSCKGPLLSWNLTFVCGNNCICILCIHIFGPYKMRGSQVIQRQGRGLLHSRNFVFGISLSRTASMSLYIYISTREIFASRNLSGAGNERKEVVGRGFPVQLGNRSGFPNW